MTLLLELSISSLFVLAGMYVVFGRPRSYFVGESNTGDPRGSGYDRG